MASPQFVVMGTFRKEPAARVGWPERYRPPKRGAYYSREEGDEIGRFCFRARRLGIPWKRLERRYGRSRTWLDKLMRRAEQAELRKQRLLCPATSKPNGGILPTILTAEITGSYDPAALAIFSSAARAKQGDAADE